MRLSDMQMSMGGGEPHEQSTQHFCTMIILAEIGGWVSL
jgi:hypothetical protein